MHIEELHSKKGEKNVTVTFDYAELRDIANGLYTATQSVDDGKQYNEIYAKCKTLFDLVKHGDIMPETIEKRCDNINNKGN